jgi:hypothetical protein
LIKNEDVEKVYEARMEICRGCGLYDESGSGCALPGSQPCCNKDKSELVDGKETKGCGCSLSLKGRSLSSWCPLNKWSAVLTLQEEEMLKKQLDDKGQG